MTTAWDRVAPTPEQKPCEWCSKPTAERFSVAGQRPRPFCDRLHATMGLGARLSEITEVKR